MSISKFPLSERHIVLKVPYGSDRSFNQNAAHSAMANPSSSPGDEAARVCLDILRGASELAQPYATHLSKLLQEEGREQERALVEALGGCLLEVVAAARGQAMAQPGEGLQVSNGSESLSSYVVPPALSM
jgi:hypothetical protein